MMYVNNKEIIGDKFVWDKCHKIYIIEDDNDLRDCQEMWGTIIFGEDLFNIEELERIYNNSCPLRFISNWKLDKQYVEQFEENVEFSMVKGV